jgi:hypothetical protein
MEFKPRNIKTLISSPANASPTHIVDESTL